MPIILSTGCDAKVSEATARDVGITELLRKPASGIEFMEAVRLALDRKK